MGQESAALNERVEPVQPLRAEQGHRCHLASSAERRARFPADLAIGHQLAQAPFRGVVGGGHVRVVYEDEQRTQIPISYLFDAPDPDDVV